MSGARAEAIVVGAFGRGGGCPVRDPSNVARDYPLPIMVVVHLPPDRNSILTELFRLKCRVAVREAEDKESIVASTIYFAPPDYHLLVEQNKRLSLSSDEPVSYSRPSIDVLFESGADAYGAGLVGIILTGANSDGARGLRAVRDAGGAILVQDPAIAQARDMPQAALIECPEARVMSLEQIAAYLQEVIKHS